MAGENKKIKNNPVAKNKTSKEKSRSHKILKRSTGKSAFRLFMSISKTLAVTAIFVLGALFIIRYSQTVNRLRTEVVDLKYAMNTDSVRQHKLQKIIGIIKQYNPKMSSEEAYDIANTIHEMSIKYTNLDVDLLCAVITHESAKTWDPRIVSPAGAMGLMQIMPVTGMFLARYEEITWTEPEEVLFNPVYNIRMGSRYLSCFMQEYNLEGALAAYNGGERIAANYVANNMDKKVLWEETRNYIPAVISLYENYTARTL
jgi:soluble lytic murein transglycosylase